MSGKFRACLVTHGYFDNTDDFASALSSDSKDSPLLYGLAVERWADEAEKRSIDDWTAVASFEVQTLRLSRSPIPPFIIITGMILPPLHRLLQPELGFKASELVRQARAALG